MKPDRRSFIGMMSALVAVGRLDAQLEANPSRKTKLKGFKPVELRPLSIEVGASIPFKAVHLSDTHLVRADATDNDARKIELAAQRYPQMGYGERYLTEAVMYARRQNAILLHTGDLYDFVSGANLKLAELLFGADDWFACVGNHEFSQYVGEAKEDAEYKAVNAGRVDAVWPNGISFDSRIVNGVNFVAVDDTYYNFTADQMSLMEKEVKKGLPIVMMCHVPIHMENHYAELMRRTGGVCSYEVGVPDELIDTWKKEPGIPSGEEWRDRRVQQRADAATLEFVKYLRAQPLLKAILSGHTHAFWQERFSPTAIQYVCSATYKGEGYSIAFS